ncbi:unnamed protein product [Polarella glacialis]|uniref:Uncharacterized protein n=1 Tax=Polarella glacialis TaxID=89957 RepID=A0A813ISK2_POLGL|nr:unnamed protein product [Polarella glacialis]CAE8659880.1 unnamed protein product [Polarella glacialis]
MKVEPGVEKKAHKLVQVKFLCGETVESHVAELVRPGEATLSRWVEAKMLQHLTTSKSCAWRAAYRTRAEEAELIAVNSELHELDAFEVMHDLQVSVMTITVELEYAPVCKRRRLSTSDKGLRKSAAATWQQTIDACRSLLALKAKELNKQGGAAAWRKQASDFRNFAIKMLVPGLVKDVVDLTDAMLAGFKSKNSSWRGRAESILTKLQEASPCL